MTVNKKKLKKLACVLGDPSGGLHDPLLEAINAVFRLEHATEVLELTYLGKYFACVNAN